MTPNILKTYIKYNGKQKYYDDGSNNVKLLPATYIYLFRLYNVLPGNTSVGVMRDYMCRCRLNAPETRGRVRKTKVRCRGADSGTLIKWF